MKMAKILSVEDDELLLETLEDFLSIKNHEISSARGGKEALEMCYKKSYDLYLWDVNLPDVSGFECLKLLRESGDKTPAIFITSATDKNSLERGFRNGADDYIKKPFDLDELNLRIQAVLSRSGKQDTLVKIDDNFSINPTRKMLLCNDKEYHINQKDFELLVLLVENRGLIVTKEMISESLWSVSQNTNYGAIRVYVNNLKKIFGKKAITNIRGVGYRFEKS